MINLISDVLDLLDRMEVQAISTPADRAFFRASGDNHYAENLPLQGELEATFTRVIDAETRGEAVPEVPAVQRRPRAYTRQEVQLQITQYLAFMVRYRHEPPVEDPIGNTAFSVLTMLDGVGPVSLPAFSVRVPGGPDLAGTLHERYADLERASKDKTPPPADT